MIRSYNFSPDGRADTSVRLILNTLLDTLRSNVEGATEGADIEFLHKLRVANRRTRTALSQIKGVIPSEAVERFAPDFRWVGSSTGPCRDLDVMLVNLHDYRQMVGAHDGDSLNDLQNFLLARRKRALEHVSATLRSSRFQTLVEGWGEFLRASTEADIEPALARSPIFDVAGPRILKANKRLRKRGARISPGSPATLLHRLRIDGKKLRYLLEFFFDLYPNVTMTRFIKELKRFQDILGGFNDTQVQLALIREFHEAHPPSTTADDVERLVESISDRQRELRAEFTDRFADFASEESRKLYKKTFKR